MTEHISPNDLNQVYVVTGHSDGETYDLGVYTDRARAESRRLAFYESTKGYAHVRRHTYFEGPLPE